MGRKFSNRKYKATKNPDVVKQTEHSKNSDEASNLAVTSVVEIGPGVVTVAEVADIAEVSNGTEVSAEESDKVRVLDEEEIVKASGEVEEVKVSDKVGEVNITDVAVVTDLRSCKHPLEHTWSFWLQANKSKNWEQNLVETTSFDTVEDYWCLYHYTKQPSELMMGQDYGIFKKGITPMWEHQANRRGGRWLLLVDKGNAEQLNQTWLNVVLMLIGQNFEDNDSITGVVVYIRPTSKIGVWTKDSKDKNANLRIGETLKTVLGLRRRLEYQPHNTTKIIHSI